MTVLLKLGATKVLIRSFKERGLVVPRKVQPVSNPLRSRSEEWFVSIADRFTPPLSEVENMLYRENPHMLCVDILLGVEILVDLSDFLYSLLDKLRNSKPSLSEEESVAALLSMLRILHGCLDYNHLKHDRHLEYHEDERSPVGYYWKRLEDLCALAAKNKKIKNPNAWARLKKLELISGPRLLTMSSQYSMTCFRRIVEFRNKAPSFSDMSFDTFLSEAKKHEEFWNRIEMNSEYFRKDPREFLGDCFAIDENDPALNLSRRRKMSEKALNEICSGLNGLQRMEFENIVLAMENFIATQEHEAFIFSGILPYKRKRGMKRTLGVLDTLLEAFDFLRDIVKRNPDLVDSQHVAQAQRVFKAEDVPSIFAAARDLVVQDALLFSEKVRAMYLEEIQRWL